MRDDSGRREHFFIPREQDDIDTEIPLIVRAIETQPMLHAYAC